MNDPDVSDVLVNGADSVFIERNGLLERTDVRFANDEHLIHFIQRLVGRAGRRIDEVSPMVDAKLPDGSRLNAVIPPLALRGPTVSIRRFKSRGVTFEDMVRTGSLTPEMADFMVACVRGRMNIVVSGGTGAGKTTMLNNISRFIPESERVVTIEQTAELQLQQRDVVALETRPPNVEGRGEISQRDLLNHRRRSSWWRSARHVASHEHRPRWLDEYCSRERYSRCPRPYGVDDCPVWRRTPNGRRSPVHRFSCPDPDSHDAFVDW